MQHKSTSNDVVLSSIPKGMEPIGTMSFNKDGYQLYCKDYRDYWDWVEARNPERYANTVSHGKNYDAKHMLHTFRLLDMGIALGSAVKTASMLNVDNRIMYRIGTVARAMKMVAWDFVMGIPLSATGKNIFFDR